MNWETIRTKAQSAGRKMSGMIMPNMGAFIAWGLITALFIPTGWIPNATLSEMVGPMIVYMLPLLIAYTGGKMVHGTRGSVIAVIATMGVIVSASIPMFLGAMIMGPLAAYVLRLVDRYLEGKIKSGFEMLVNNFTMGILGTILAILGVLAFGPVVELFSNIMGDAVQVFVDAGLLPLAAIFIEPAKVLFLNNAINHGVLTPLGIAQAADAGKSIFFMLEANPGPGLGVLLAFWVFAKKGMIKDTAPGAIIIHFFGGIHEIYFPYILMKPILILAVIAGGATGIFVFDIFNVGLVASPSPGSIFAFMAMTPKGNFFGVLAGIAASTAVSFLVASFFIKRDKGEQDLDAATEQMLELKGKKGLTTIAFACDAGMGSSAMGASTLRSKFKKAGVNVKVIHCAVDEIPLDIKLVVTHKDLQARAQKRVPKAEIVTITNFVGAPEYDQLVEKLK